ncbi:hypothetical protein BZA77DRAFT_343780 [Pyronema omphalodes]|nr:hypothetical protein BZA77DRAFT_343780 [Pyronema omphalodes]
MQSTKRTATASSSAASPEMHDLTISSRPPTRRTIGTSKDRDPSVVRTLQEREWGRGETGEAGIVDAVKTISELSSTDPNDSQHILRDLQNLTASTTDTLASRSKSLESALSSLSTANLQITSLINSASTLLSSLSQSDARFTTEFSRHIDGLDRLGSEISSIEKLRSRLQGEKEKVEDYRRRIENVRRRAERTREVERGRKGGWRGRVFWGTMAVVVIGWLLATGASEGPEGIEGIEGPEGQEGEMESLVGEFPEVSEQTHAADQQQQQQQQPEEKVKSLMDQIGEQISANDRDYPRDHIRFIPRPKHSEDRSHIRLSIPTMKSTMKSKVEQELLGLSVD